MKNRVRIGIIGAGNIVKTRHLPALLAMPEADIVAVCNSTPASSQAFCREFVPQAEPMEHWPELIGRDDINTVWIGTPPYKHQEMSCYALRSGKHVFCQARMASDLAEAQLMWEASMSNPELVTAICPPPYGMKGDKVVREILESGAIGQPHQIFLRSFHGDWLNAEAPAHWRQRVEVSGLQVLSFGIYVEVLQRWLGDIVSVYADGAILTSERQGYTVEVPDFLNVLCEFRNGARGSLSFSGVAAQHHGDTLEVHGREGVLTYHFGTDEIRVGRVGQPLELVPIPEDKAVLWTVERDFVRAVLDPQAPRPKPDFLEGMKYMRVVQAAAESMDGGDRVRVA